MLFSVALVDMREREEWEGEADRIGSFGSFDDLGLLSVRWHCRAHGSWRFTLMEMQLRGRVCTRAFQVRTEVSLDTTVEK